jgi:hypothetical protein
MEHGVEEMGSYSLSDEPALQNHPIYDYYS